MSRHKLSVTRPCFITLLHHLKWQLHALVKAAQFNFQFFTLNLQNSDTQTKSRGVDCERANLD